MKKGCISYSIGILWNYPKNDMRIMQKIHDQEVDHLNHTLLDIQNIQVSIEQKPILNGINLTVNQGELHVLMGPNGAGKSTLASAIMGDPRYTLDQGRITFEGTDITEEKTDVRARLGIFLSFQLPEEIPGVTLENFLRTAEGAITGETAKVFSFRRKLREQMEALHMDPSYADRYLNVGFSGGEKKKAEILQLLMLRPKLAMLDEADSGLDVDAVKTVTKGIHAYRNEKNSLLIITHNAKILEGLDVDYVHVLERGRIIQTGGPELIREITDGGFAAIEKEADTHGTL